MRVEGASVCCASLSWFVEVVLSLVLLTGVARAQSGLAVIGITSAGLMFVHFAARGRVEEWEISKEYPAPWK